MRIRLAKMKTFALLMIEYLRNFITKDFIKAEFLGWTQDSMYQPRPKEYIHISH